jgi:hypothetical protein
VFVPLQLQQQLVLLRAQLQHLLHIVSQLCADAWGAQPARRISRCVAVCV